MGASTNEESEDPEEEIPATTTDDDNDIGDDDRRVMQPLMIAGGADTGEFAFEDEYEESYSRKSIGQFSWIQFRAVTLVIVMILGGYSFALLGQSGDHHHHDASQDILTFSCPASVTVAKNYDPCFEEGYAEVSKNIGKNMTAFLETFRTTKFDEWGKTYEQVKAGLRPFKEKYFAPNLKDGDTIFESACGIGLNLYMTLEIVHEVANISNLVVYGNDYVAASALDANLFFDQAAPYGAQKGTICPGDSSKLREFVPANAFDLVYTGYISVILDPLEIGGDIDDTLVDYYRPLCEADDWKSVLLRNISQDRQEDWFGNWVTEMIRLAKPGKPVIIENVSPPYCGHFYDWGGVAKDFWRKGVDRYGWDVDPDSIELEDNPLFRSRYDVFMRKTAKVKVDNDDDDDERP